MNKDFRVRARGLLRAKCHKVRHPQYVGMELVFIHPLPSCSSSSPWELGCASGIGSASGIRSAPGVPREKSGTLTLRPEVILRPQDGISLERIAKVIKFPEPVMLRSVPGTTSAVSGFPLSHGSRKLETGVRARAEGKWSFERLLNLPRMTTSRA